MLWHDNPFSQINKVTKRAGGRGGDQTKCEEEGIDNIEEFS